MRQDYPEGLRIKTLEKGVPGEIIRPEKLSIGVFHYWVKLDDEKAPKLMHYNMIAPADHPWHQKMIEWRPCGNFLPHFLKYFVTNWIRGRKSCKNDRI